MSDFMGVQFYCHWVAVLRLSCIGDFWTCNVWNLLQDKLQLYAASI